MQSLAQRLSRRRDQAVSPETGRGPRQPAVLYGSGGPDREGGIAQALGPAGMQRPAGANVGQAGEAGPENPSGSDERDEPAAGEPAACGSSHRAADHYRVPEVEEPPGGIQR